MSQPKLEFIPGDPWPYKLLEDITYTVDFLHDVAAGSIVANRVSLDQVPPPKLTVRARYAFNGPSIPRFIRWAVPYKKLAVGPSLLHDVLYQAARLKHLQPHHRKPADKRFREDLKRNGMPSWAAALYYSGVRLGGRPSFFGKPETFRG